MRWVAHLLLDESLHLGERPVLSRAYLQHTANPPQPTVRLTTLRVTQGQILSQSPTDVTRFWWLLYGS